MPTSRPVQAEQQHDREQHLGEARREVVERAAERGAGEQRHDHAGREDEERRRPRRATISMIQNSVEASRNASLRRPCWSSSVNTGHERRRQRRVGEQVADEVRDLEGDRERRETAAGAEEARGDDFAHQPRDPREAGGDREDRRVASHAASAGRSWRRRLLRGGFSSGRQGRYSTALRGAPGQLHPASRGLFHGQHPLPEEAHPAHRARAPGEPPLHVGDQDALPQPGVGRQTAAMTQAPTPPTASWSARSTRPSSAARCTATTARTRSPRAARYARSAAASCAAQPAIAPIARSASVSSSSAAIALRVRGDHRSAARVELQVGERSERRAQAIGVAARDVGDEALGGARRHAQPALDGRLGLARLQPQRPPTSASRRRWDIR